MKIGSVLSRAVPERGARSQTLRVGNGRPANLLFRRSQNPRKCAGWSARAIRYDSTDDRRCARVLGVTLENLDGGDIFTHRLLCLGCDACGLLIAMYSDRCFSVWSDSGELEGRISANPDRDLDLLGEPSVTNIDVLIPGHGPGTLLLVFRTSFSFDKECEKTRALCPNNLAKKKGEPRPIFKFRCLRSF